MVIAMGLFVTKMTNSVLRRKICCDGESYDLLDHFSGTTVFAYSLPSLDLMIVVFRVLYSNIYSQ